MQLTLILADGCCVSAGSAHLRHPRQRFGEVLRQSTYGQLGYPTGCNNPGFIVGPIDLGAGRTPVAVDTSVGSSDAPASSLTTVREVLGT